MLESLSKNETFEYQKMTPEEMKSKGILGRLIGPCADLINPTRNGRGYGEELWEKVFDDQIVNEKIENKCLFGELGHPADREEVDMEKIAIALNEKPKKDDSGKLIACFDILDTPNGRILKTLCDYGTTIGISSRGTGEVIGDEVDPESYTFECFDAVIVPAVKEARLSYVAESLDRKGPNLKKALRESLDSASDEDREVMKQTLNELDIDVEEEEEKGELKEGFLWFNLALAFPTREEADAWVSDHLKPESERKLPGGVKEDEGSFVVTFNIFDIIDGKEDDVIEQVRAQLDEIKGSNPEKDEHKSASADGGEPSKQEIEEPEGAEDSGSEEIIKSLQEAIKAKSDLESQVKQLQEKVAVSDAKVAKLEEELTDYKSATVKMSKLAVSNKDLTDKVSALEEELSKKAEAISIQNARIGKLVEEKKASMAAKSKTDALNESLAVKDAEIKTLNDNFNEIKSDYDGRIASLTESIEKLKSESESKDKELDRESKLRESYKNLANKAVKRYIESRATMLGVKSSEIMGKLPEDYSLDDIDLVCEELQTYELNIAKLPFRLTEKSRVKVSKSVNESLPSSEQDDVDESLYRLAKLI